MEESLSLGPATEHLLTPSVRVGDAWWGGGILRGQHAAWCSCSRSTGRCRPCWPCAPCSQSHPCRSSPGGSTAGGAASRAALAPVRSGGATCWRPRVVIRSPFPTRLLRSEAVPAVRALHHVGQCPGAWSPAAAGTLGLLAWGPARHSPSGGFGWRHLLPERIVY